MSSVKDNTGMDKIGFGQKSEKFLRKKSRQAVEKYSDTSLFYFEVDYDKSYKNFYGELLIKEWVNPQGTQLFGTIDVAESDESELNGLPNKLLSLEFSCYIEHLKEIGVMPKIGNYFTTKNEIYIIQDKTLLDSNKHSINTDSEAIAMEFKCTQVDDETMNYKVIEKITANKLLSRGQNLDDFSPDDY
jgi:hypothetical protein